MRIYTNDSANKLRGLLPPGATIYTAVKYVSRSGMMRVISLYVVENGRIRDDSWKVYPV